MNYSPSSPPFTPHIQHIQHLKTPSPTPSTLTPHHPPLSIHPIKTSTTHTKHTQHHTSQPSKPTTILQSHTLLLHQSLQPDRPSSAIQPSPTPAIRPVNMSKPPTTEPGPPGWAPHMGEELIKAWDRGVRGLGTLKERLDHFYHLEPDSYTVEFLRGLLRGVGRNA